MIRSAALAGLATLLFTTSFVAAQAAITTPTTTPLQLTVTETATAPPTTVVETSTVERTVTRRVVVPTAPAATTTTAGSGEGTPTWVWVLLGILLAGLIVLAILLARRGGGAASSEERQRRLDGAVATWAAQGWAIESQAADSAVLRRGGELMLVSVDAAGGVTTRPLPSR